MLIKTYGIKKFFAPLVLVILYACISLTYFSVLDLRFYAKNILNCNFAFAIPIPYILFSGLFIFIYPVVLRQKIRSFLYPATAIAVILPFFYLLIDFMIGIRLFGPFGGNRGVFGAYATGYFFFFISLFSVLCGLLFRKLFKGELAGPLRGADAEMHNLIFHVPVFMYFVYVAGILLSNGFILYGVYVFILFFLGVLSGKVSGLLQKLKMLLAQFAQNEKLFLITVFTVAFLVRYFWGMRILGITGANFILASDDGVCYDKFASILANGGLIPREGLFIVTGFSYWYFLAALYKIFGIHNFQAVIAIQAFIGASVPVLTYYIAGKIFKTKFVPVAASVLTAFNMMLIFLSVVLGMEVLYIPLVLLGLALAITYIGDKTLDYKKAFLMGLAFGMAYSARPPELLLFAPLLACIIYFFMRKKISKKAMVGIIAFLFTGFILFASIQYISNYVQYGERHFLPVAAQGSFWCGINEGGHTDENKMLGEMGFNPFKDPKKTLSVFMQKPGTVSNLFVKGFFKRLVIFWCYPNFGVFDPYYLVNPASGYFFRFPVYAQTLGCILLFGGIVAAFLREERLAGLVILLSIIAYMSIRVAVFYILNARYRGAITPAFLIFFAYGLEAFWGKIKEAYGHKKVG